MLDFCYQKTDTPAKPNQRLLEMATHTLAISDIREIPLALKQHLNRFLGSLSYPGFELVTQDPLLYSSSHCNRFILVGFFSS